jgi:hypothetical protein
MIELEPTIPIPDDVEKILEQTRVAVRELLVDFAKVPEPEALAYTHGFYRGWCGDDILANGRSAKHGFSDRYLEGYKLGQGVRAGTAEMPPWADEAD